MIPLFIPRGKKIPPHIGQEIGEADLPGWQSKRGFLEEHPDKKTRGKLYQMTEADWCELNDLWVEGERIEIRPLFWGEKIPAEGYRNRPPDQDNS